VCTVLWVAPEVDVSAIAIRPNGSNVTGELQCVIKYEMDQPLFDASWELKVQAADDARKLIQRVWQLLIDYASKRRERSACQSDHRCSLILAFVQYCRRYRLEIWPLKKSSRSI